jgi:hypothetical protein
MQMSMLASLVLHTYPKGIGFVGWQNMANLYFMITCTPLCKMRGSCCYICICFHWEISFGCIKYTHYIYIHCNKIWLFVVVVSLHICVRQINIMSVVFY